ncbi:protein aurora borealis [Schistosoma japonicum]|nr:protein aurora borealis [Schistosoma japonicum]
MENPGVATPVKVCPLGDEFGITTPSGGLIFNPFHREFLSRVGQVNFSPGIFAYNPSPISKSGSRKTTPNRINTPFILSPDIQGELFPADIDENPVLQLELQEKLDTQCDDEIQNKIHSFFKNHLIAPSPDTVVVNSPNKFHTSCLPRTSSLLPTGKSKLQYKQQSLCLHRFDFESIMQIAFEHHSTNSPYIPKSFVQKLSRTSTESNEILSDGNDVTFNPSHQRPNPAVNNISLSACAVHRPTPLNSNNTLLSTLYKNSRHLLSRRSLFSDSSEINEPSLVLISFSPNESSSILIKETAALQMCLPISWADHGNSDSSDDSDYHNEIINNENGNSTDQGMLSSVTDIVSFLFSLMKTVILNAIRGI